MSRHTRAFPLVALLLLALLLPGCGQVPDAGISMLDPSLTPTLEDPRHGGLPSPMPPTPYPLNYTPPPTETPDSYPWPTSEPPLMSTPATPVPVPTPVLMGAEMAPLELQQTYVSTTLVVASVGTGSGELGYSHDPVDDDIWADEFVVNVSGNIYVLDKDNQRIVQFDPAGQFVRNILFQEQAPDMMAAMLAVDGEGVACIYDQGGATRVRKIKCFDSGGYLAREYPKPTWLEEEAYDLWFDEQGMLWVLGLASAIETPTIEDSPYGFAAIPLGNSSETLNEAQQQALAVPGYWFRTGGPVFIECCPQQIYNQQGNCTFWLEEAGSLVAVDRWGNFYTRKSGYLFKYDPAGRTVASFPLPNVDPARGVLIRRWITPDGIVYVLALDRVDRVYRIIRWQP